jgi:hypothetical protein
MKTEDELDAQIAKLFDEGTTTKVEMVNGKPRISDQATLDQVKSSRMSTDRGYSNFAVKERVGGHGDVARRERHRSSVK